MAERGLLKRVRGWVAARREAGARPAAETDAAADPLTGAAEGGPERAGWAARTEDAARQGRRSEAGRAGDEGVRPPQSQASARERTAAAAGSMASVLREGAGAARRAGAQARRAWLGVPLAVRQRIAAIGALAALAALVAFVLLPLAPCWAPAGDRCPPGDDAIDLVPAGSAAYLHANLDAETDQAEAAGTIADRLPTLTTIAIASLPGISFDAISYDRDIRPWSAGEVGVVLEPSGSSLDRLLMLEVNDDGREAAIEFGTALLGAGARDFEIEGVEAKVNSRGVAAAVSGGFLLVGEEGRVAESIALAAGDGESLAEDAAAEAAREGLPESRLADAYLSAPLLARLGDEKRLAAFDTFLESGASEGAAASLSADEDGLALAVRSVLDPDVATDSSEFFSALDPFEPSLAEEVRPDTLAYVGIGDPARSAETLIERAAETSPELFSGLEQLTRRLRRADGIELERRLLPLLSGEVALTVEPQLPPGEEEDGPAPATPYLALLATEVGDDATRELAELQAPIARAVDPGSGQVPVFETRGIAGVEVQSLRISPVVELSYGTFDERLLVATSPVAFERARSDSESLADSERFGRLTADLPELSSFFLYLDVEGLLDLGEALFLAEDPGYARLAPDLRVLTAAALSVRRSANELDTDLRVGVGEPDPLLAAEPGLP